MNIRSLPQLALLIVGIILLTEWVQESCEKKDDEPKNADSSGATEAKAAKKGKKSKEEKASD